MVELWRIYRSENGWIVAESPAEHMPLSITHVADCNEQLAKLIERLARADDDRVATAKAMKGNAHG